MLIWLSGAFVRGLSPETPNQQAARSLADLLCQAAASCDLSPRPRCAAILGPWCKFITFEVFTEPNGVYTSIPRPEILKSETCCAALWVRGLGEIPPNFFQPSSDLEMTKSPWWSETPAGFDPTCWCQSGRDRSIHSKHHGVGNSSLTHFVNSRTMNSSSNKETLSQCTFFN